MSTAYIVCGPESSGNRLLAAILCRSGCTGEGSTNQPSTIYQLPTAAVDPYVMIAHGALGAWIQSLRRRDWTKIVAILLIREPIANCKSMVEVGHYPDFEEAYRRRVLTIESNVSEVLSHQAILEIVTYEGLSESFLREWLPRIGLPYVPGPLNLPGQIAPVEIQNQNGKHYDSLPSL